MLLDARTGELSTSGPRTEDFTVIGPRTYDVELRLFTRAVGMPTETGPIPLDWRTVVHLGVNLRVEGRYVGFPLDIATTPEGVPTLAVQGSPGETFQMCATGHEGQLAAGCTRVTDRKSTRLNSSH